MTGRAVSLCVAVLLAAATLSCAARDLVVASYNVENYLPTDRRVDGRFVKDAPKPEQEIAAVIRIVSEIKPDILGVIEMGDESMLADFQNRLKAAGMDFPYSEWVKGADAHRHIALLSKLPILERNSRDDVPFELNGVQTRMGRGILDVSVEPAPGQKLRLVGLHLKSRRQVADFDESAMRAREAWFVREHLDAILEKDPSSKLLVFGDFNDTKNEYPVRQLIGQPGSPRHMRDLYLSDDQGFRWTHFWGAADVYSRIDFFLVSNALWPWVDMRRSGISSSTDWNKASDHRAIFTTLRVP